MFYESDSSSEFVFAESKSSYSFSLLSDFPMVSVSSYLEYPNRVSVQTDNSGKYSEKFRILTDLSRRFEMPPSKDLNFENRVFRILYKIFAFKNLCFCKPIPQPSCCNLGSDTTKCNTPNPAQTLWSDPTCHIEAFKTFYIVDPEKLT